MLLAAGLGAAVALRHEYPSLVRYLRIRRM